MLIVFCRVRGRGAFGLLPDAERDNSIRKSGLPEAIATVLAMRAVEGTGLSFSSAFCTSVAESVSDSGPMRSGINIDCAVGRWEKRFCGISLPAK